MNHPAEPPFAPLAARVIGLARDRAAQASAKDLDRVTLHLLDWLGCMLGGAASPPGRLFLAAFPAPDAPLQATEVALRFGGLGSLLEMDDVDRQGLIHPGPVVAAAAVAALSERPDLPRLKLLQAILAGYEAMIRLGRALGPEHYAQFHNSSTAGGLGAVVAAGSVLGLTDDQMLSAAGHCLSMAGGLWECRNSPTATKHLHVAECTRRGLQTALWAQAGLAGPPRILEGRQGFFAGLAPQGRPEAMLAPAPEALIHQVSFKLWAACRHAHAGIDAVLAAARGVDTAQITRVEISSFADALLFCDRLVPRSIGEAKFSLQHAAAVTLAHGRPELRHFEPPFLDDPVIAALRERVVLHEDTTFSKAFPAHFGAAATLHLRDGSSRHAQVPDAWGDRENPASPADVHDKFRAITAHAGLAPEAAKALQSATLSLPGGHGDCTIFLAALDRISPLHQPRD